MTSTYLVTWNSTQWNWNDLAAAIKAVERGSPNPTIQWGTGNFQIDVGSFVYLLWKDDTRGGIIGSGIAVSPSDAAPLVAHEGKSAYVTIRFDRLINIFPLFVNA